MGAEKNDISNYRDRIVGRAVLLDLPRFREVQWLEPGRSVSGDELQACADAPCLIAGHQYHLRLTPETAVKALDEIRKQPPDHKPHGKD